MTVTAVVALTPSTWPVIVALPALTAVTSPTAETVAAAGFELDQFTARLPNTAPLASRAMAEIRAVSPGNKASVVGVTDTLAAGISVTATSAVAVRPSAAA